MVTLCPKYISYAGRGTLFVGMMDVWMDVPRSLDVCLGLVYKLVGPWRASRSLVSKVEGAGCFAIAHKVLPGGLVSSCLATD